MSAETQTDDIHALTFRIIDFLRSENQSHALVALQDAMIITLIEEIEDDAHEVALDRFAAYQRDFYNDMTTEKLN